ncbi:MAG: hypothetical protein Q610_ECBC00253G0001, partial [Escherichia coli DORA_B_14]
NAFANWQFFQRRQFHANRVTARVAHRGRAVVIVIAGIEHLATFVFIARGHNDHFRYTAQVREVKSALMGLTVSTNNARAVDGEQDRKLCIGTENYFCINKEASEADQKATQDFINWLFTSDKGKDYVTNELGFIAPFDTFSDKEAPQDPLAK